MRFAAPIMALTLLCLLAPAARAEDPRLDRVDYADPKAQLVLGGTVGAGQRSQGIARQLAAKGKTPTGTLSQIVRWVGRNLRIQRGKTPTWRTVDQLLADGYATGEADRALVIGVIARLAGIPATWVKSLHAEALEVHLRKQRPIKGPMGRIFLEVYVDRRWQLLDPVTAALYPDHDVRARKLPGGHLAYDKGGDPYALVLPNRFELWRGQLEEYLRRTQKPRNAYARAVDLLAPWRIYVTGQGSAATYAREGCKTLGYLVARASSRDWKASLKLARGKTLVVTTSEGKPVLPKNLWASYLGADVAATYEAGSTPAKPWIKKTLSDGTRVILVTVTEYGPVELAVSEALEG